MEKKTFIVEGGPPAGGPYSHACAAGNLLFVSGQLAFQRDGSGYKPMSLQEEARLTLENLQIVLEGAGSGLDYVVKTLCFLDDINDFAAFNEVYSEFFAENKPARSCIEVANIPLGAKVEVEAIAIIPGA